MKRSERMMPVQKVLGDTESDRARDLGAAQKGLQDAESRLQELRQYQNEYLAGFQQRGKAGQNALALRDYQLFLSRLEEAVRQQEQLVEQARQGVKGSATRWQSAAQKVKAVDSVVGKWRQNERRVVERGDQKESDERAQQRAPGNKSRTSEQG